MVRFFSRAAAVLLATGALIPTVARAEEQQLEPTPLIIVGPVIAHPSLALKETYSDNVFFSAKNTKSDFVTSVAPDLTLKMPLRMHELTLGASAEFLFHAEHSSLDTTPYQLLGLGDFLIGDRVSLKVGDVYQRNEESPLESPNATSDVYTANRAALSVKYSFVDVSQLQIDYARLSLDYIDSAYRTREEDLLSFYLYYRVLPNTSAFLEYDLSNVAYDDTKMHDNVTHTGLIGASWAITEYSKGTAKIGYLSKNYADAALKDHSTWTASADLQHRLNGAASLRLMGKREVNEGKHEGIRFYTTTALFADFTYIFLDRLSGVIEGSYSLDEFSNAAAEEKIVREDKTAHVGLTAKYHFNSWLDCALSYGYSNRNSNIDDRDAIINTVSLKVTAYR